MNTTSWWRGEEYFEDRDESSQARARNCRRAPMGSSSHGVVVAVAEGWVVGGTWVLAVELPLKLQTAAVAILRIDAQLMAGM